MCGVFKGRRLTSLAAGMRQAFFQRGRYVGRPVRAQNRFTGKTFTESSCWPPATREASRNINNTSLIPREPASSRSRLQILPAHLWMPCLVLCFLSDRDPKCHISFCLSCCWLGEVVAGDFCCGHPRDFCFITGRCESDYS